MTTSPEIVLNAAKTLAWDELEPRQREIYLGCARIELADRASVADRGAQAVPGEPVANITAGRVKLLADVFAEEACDFLSEEAPSKEQEDAYYKAKSAIHKAIDTLAASVASPAAPALPVVPAKVYLIATGETHSGYETYTRHENSVPFADHEVLYTAPIDPDTSPTAPASPSVAQAEPSEDALLAQRIQVFGEPNGPGSGAPLPELFRAVSNTGKVMITVDTSLPQDSATLPSTPKAEGEGKQS